MTNVGGFFMKLQITLFKNKPYGFTLCEMLVVLVILAFLTALLTPTFLDAWQQIRMETVMQQLHRDIRWAQEQAEQEQRQITIVFFCDKQPYRYIIRFSGQATYLRRRELPDRIEKMEAKTIVIPKVRQFQKNGHVLFQKGGWKYYVYYYQTGRTRICKTAV